MSPEFPRGTLFVCFYIETFSASSRYPLNRCSRNERFAAEKVSSAVAKRTSEAVQRRARERIFRDCGGCHAARKRVNSVDGMEMSGTRNETGKRDRTTEMQWLARVAGGAMSAETEEEEHKKEGRSGRRGEEDTTQTAEKSIGNGAQEHAPARGEGEEPSLRSFRPLARQTALRPT
ncbi:Uncharacterized protein DBV15_07399 [Temnothorax longispinosus]|uniref:Uncharacterized protein n=1 Tax=Temnothorax longispinosus TaxID=300112 RepID=A0A4S2L462_9HYME|nr:Uncharacterized protein DBV15_07399 [Temnothorax longispinosus]